MQSYKPKQKPPIDLAWHPFYKSYLFNIWQLDTFTTSLTPLFSPPLPLSLVLVINPIYTHRYIHTYIQYNHFPYSRLFFVGKTTCQASIIPTFHLPEQLLLRFELTQMSKPGLSYLLDLVTVSYFFWNYGS